MTHHPFTCTGNQIEQDVIEACSVLNFSRHQAETTATAMAQTAAYIRSHHQHVLCYVPFNNIIEASAWGAVLKQPQGHLGFRISTPAYTRPEDLLAVPEPQWQKGIGGTVLQSLEILKRQGEFLSLHVLGPFTVLTMLVDLSTCFKAWRTKPTIFWQVLSRLSKSICLYSQQAAQAGAAIISYADPLNAVMILGPKRFNELAEHHTLPFLQSLWVSVQRYSILHLCGHLSSDLEASSLGHSTPLQTADSTYDAALYHVYHCAQPPYPMLGNHCIHAFRGQDSSILYEFHL